MKKTFRITIILIISILFLGFCKNPGKAHEEKIPTDINSEDSLQQFVDLAVNELLKSQEPDGVWPYEGVYRVDGKIPVGYRIGGTAIVCQMLLYSPTKYKNQTKTAISKGIDFILEALEDPLMKASTQNNYDVRVWGHSYSLNLFSHLRLMEYSLTTQQAAAIDKWIPNLVKTLIIEEIPGGGWNYANHKQQATFVTAPVVQALLRARSLGIDVPDEIFQRSRDILLISRHTDGAFIYSGGNNADQNPQQQDNKEDTRSMQPGSIARSALCESTLFLLGSGSVDNIKNAVDAFFIYWDELKKRWKQPGTHEPPYGIAPYYFYFGHYYAGQAIEFLPVEYRKDVQKKLKQTILRTRDPDGTWNDRVFPRSRSYGTAMAIMTLIAKDIPKPQAISFE